MQLCVCVCLCAKCVPLCHHAGIVVRITLIINEYVLTSVCSVSTATLLLPLQPQSTCLAFFPWPTHTLTHIHIHQYVHSSFTSKLLLFVPNMKFCINFTSADICGTYKQTFFFVVAFPILCARMCLPSCRQLFQ